MNEGNGGTKEGIEAVAELSVLYRDEEIVVISKPAGLLTHRTALSTDRVTVMSLLRDQLGTFVYPLHRLDRKTSGVQVFGLSSEAAGVWAQCFRESTAQKSYLAIVRGWEDGERHRIERALRYPDVVESKEAITEYRGMGNVEWPEPFGGFEQGRFSLVEVWPETGRMHQIRRHLGGVNHPLAGDTVHGDGRVNRYFREHFGWNRMFLHATELTLEDPRDAGRVLEFRAPLEGVFLEAVERFGWLGSARLAAYA